jgi:ABC-type sugar transport system ATPase subunit
MNFVYATTKTVKNGTEISFGDSKITSKNAPENLKKFEGKEIVLGIRPEAFEDATYANSEEYTEKININISLLEQLGSDSYIHFYKRY